jgi:hypothetical protein
VIYWKGNKKSSPFFLTQVRGEYVSELLLAVATDVFAQGFLELSVGAVVNCDGVLVYQDEQKQTLLKQDQLLDGLGNATNPVHIVFPTGIFSLLIPFLCICNFSFFFYLLSINVFAN